MKQYLRLNKKHILLLFFIALVLVLLWPTWSILFVKWSLPDDPLSHGWLVACICLIQLLATSSFLKQSTRAPAFGLLGFLFLTSLCAMVATLLSIETIATALLPLVLLSALLLYYGLNNIRALWFPVFYLYFAIPVWEPLTAVLQWVTTIINGELLAMTGIAVAIDGNTIQIPVGKFEVAGGCSGIKYFITSLSLSTLYAHWYIRSARQKITLIAFSMLLALLTNWIRVYLIVLIGQYTQMQHPLINDHENFGWILYAVSLIPFFLMVRAYSDEPLQNAHTDKRNVDAPPRKNWLWTAGILMLPFTLWIAMTSIKQNIPLLTPQADYVATVSAQFPLSPLIYNYSSKTIERMPHTGRKQTIWFSNYYFDGPWQSELSDYRNDFFPHPWRRIDQDFRKTSTEHAQTVMLSHPVQGKQFVVVYWYEVDHQTTRSALWAKVLQLSKAPVGRGGAALRMLMTSCHADCSRESASLNKMVDMISQREYMQNAY